MHLCRYAPKRLQWGSVFGTETSNGLGISCAACGVFDRLWQQLCRPDAPDGMIKAGSLELHRSTDSCRWGSCIGSLSSLQVQLSGVGAAATACQITSAWAWSILFPSLVLYAVDNIPQSCNASSKPSCTLTGCLAGDIWPTTTPMKFLFCHAPPHAWLCVAGQLTHAVPSHSADVVIMYTCRETMNSTKYSG